MNFLPARIAGGEGRTFHLDGDEGSSVTLPQLRAPHPARAFVRDGGRLR